MKQFYRKLIVIIVAISILASSVFTTTTVYASEIPSTDTTTPEDSVTTKKHYVVVLDPGHGRAGTGTYRDYGEFVIDEAIINFKISQYTKVALETNYDNVTVYLTKTSQDENPSLKERVALAVEKRADVLISQHVNATPDNRTDVNGVMAMVPTVDETHAFHKESALFSQVLARKVLDELVLLEFNDKGFYYKLSMDNTLYPDGSLADYYGIVRICRENSLPGAIIEHGFANNESDARKLNDEEMLKKIGAADAKGIMEFLAENPEFGLEISSLRGWQQVEGTWVYYDSQGLLVHDWQRIDGAWYYFNDAGIMQTGWVLDGNTWYHMNASGAMQTGWIYVGNTWYYLNPYGAMQTGWVLDGNAWYYMNRSGAMQVGWVKDGANWYYMNSSGAMATGWQNIGGTWYYLDRSGAMQTGWVYTDNNWYYLNKSGAMQVGWVKDDGAWYYLNKSGAMLIGVHTIDGISYTFNTSGKLVSE